MTTINASSLNSYSTRFTVAVKKDVTAEAADSSISTTTETGSASASTPPAAGGAGGAGSASDSSSASDRGAFSCVAYRLLGARV
jgi:hypothetical protein